MLTYVLIVLAGLLVVGLIVRSVIAQRHSSQNRRRVLEELGFSPCPDRKEWLEQTIARLEDDRGVRYEVRNPKWLAGESPVYHYERRRHADTDEDSTGEEQILCAVKRPSADGLVLIVKPSSLAPGLATRMLGALATGPWDAQPDGLRRLELPPDLRETNLLGALGPPGASFYDLVDSRTLSVVQGFGDAGGMFVRFRDAWCSIARGSAQMPFRIDELVARVRSLR